MSATHPAQSFATAQSFAADKNLGAARSFATDLSFDTGENHLKPALIAILIAAATTVISLALIGLPH
jgi:hypothetical protein